MTMFTKIIYKFEKCLGSKKYLEILNIVLFFKEMFRNSKTLSHSSKKKIRKFLPIFYHKLYKIEKIQF